MKTKTPDPCRNDQGRDAWGVGRDGVALFWLFAGALLAFITVLVLS